MDNACCIYFLLPPISYTLTNLKIGTIPTIRTARWLVVTGMYVALNECNIARIFQIQSYWELRPLLGTEASTKAEYRCLLNLTSHDLLVEQNATKGAHPAGNRQQCSTILASQLRYRARLSSVGSSSPAYGCHHCWGTGLPYGLPISRTDHNPPRGPSADWWVLTAANTAGTNGLMCLPKHGSVVY
jgi:hypothetical protein